MSEVTEQQLEDMEALFVQTAASMTSDREPLRHLAALRAVVKRGFIHDMADQLLYDLERQFPG